MPTTHAGVVGQVWRGGAPRALLARLLDAVDAALVLLAVDGDLLLTSDTGDLGSLAEATGTHLELIHV
ncbi:MAG TPA: hypothetical protein VIJ51_13140 [Solirubrobacteraceae bacterium]